MTIRFLAPLLSLFALTVGHGYVGTPEQVDWESVRAAQPPGLSLRIELPKTAYHQGEVIEAKLVFQNTSAASYHLWTGTADTTGRVPDIAFYAVDERGARVRDPVRWYFERGGPGGGAGSTEDLAEWSVTLAANEWLCFEKPGRYTLRAFSNRVKEGDRSGRGGASDPTGKVELVSDPVTITLTPLGAAEEERMITTCVAQMDHGGQSAEAAAARLRHLGTPASREALLPFLSEKALSIPVTAALCASPDPEKEAAAIFDGVRTGKLLHDGATANAYVCLKTAGHQAGPWPSTREEAGPKQWNHEKKANLSSFCRLYGGDLYYARLEPIAGKRQEYYLKMIAETFFKDPSARTRIRDELVKVQLDLSLDLGKQILSHWDVYGAYRGKEFLPLVRKLAGRPAYDPRAIKILASLEPTPPRRSKS